MLERLRAALGDRYTIGRELGHGGNAVVYLAQDLKHQRQVALKVLLPELALSVRTERFLREIQIAGKLTHPHILTLIDSGEVDGGLYYVMPYVAGESLRDWLKRDKHLSLEDALRITREVADALSYAHRHDVVHRDIKPENILLADGHAMVADFGIARALSAAASGTVTETGLAVGTPAYMSPEQGAGSKDVDGRSDVYALGCVLYEMLASHPPFTGDSAQEILARHALDPVPRLAAARPDVPDVVERAVRKALAKSPADRFATPAALAKVLSASVSFDASPVWRRPLIYASLTLVLLAGTALVARALLGGDRPARRSVAVLPFVNLSGDADNEYLTDGMTEELINALVQIEGLQVPARTSSFYFKGKTLTAGQIAESLHVATVLEGSLRRTGDKLRITAQLISAADGYHLWSNTYDRELRGVEDAIPVQEEIARAIIAALHVTLTGDTGAALVRRHSGDPEAYELYLRGRFFWNKRTAQDMTRAIEYFGRAVAKDSTYALAYSGLSDAFVLAGAFAYLTVDEAYPKARAAASRAIALDQTLAEAHTSLARAYWNQDRDAAGAEREFRVALELNPSYALAHSWYAFTVLANTGRYDEAIREARRGVELEPLTAAMQNNLGWVFLYAGRFDQAIAPLQKAREMEPEWRAPLRGLGNAYVGSGRFDEALVYLERALGASGPAPPVLRIELARAYVGKGMREQALVQARHVEANASANPGDLALAGEVFARANDRTGATRVQERLVSMPPRGDVWRAIGIVHAWLGETDSAFAALERAHESGVVFPGIRNSPVFEPFRADPRFGQFLTKIGQRP